MPRLCIFISLLIILVAGMIPESSRAGDPFAIQSAYDGLDQEEERIRALRIPIFITLRSWQDRPYGLRLRLAVTLATSDLFDALDGGFEVVRMNSFVPGLEWVFPVGGNHLLRPHVDVGMGFASDVDKQAFLTSIGLRTEFVFAGKHFFAGLEPRFQVDSRMGANIDTKSTFSPSLTLSGRRVLGFTISGHQPDAGLFLESGYDFNALELTSVSSTRDAVGTQWELGIGFGFSQSMPKIAIFRWPRIRVGYRFGDIEGWRIRIGGDWLNSVLGLSHPRSSS